MSIPTLEQKTATVTFQATAYDQYGQVMSGETFAWSIQDVMAGETGDPGVEVENGIVTIKPHAPVQNVIIGGGRRSARCLARPPLLPARRKAC